MGSNPEGRSHVTVSRLCAVVAKAPGLVPGALRRTAFGLFESVSHGQLCNFVRVVGSLPYLSRSSISAMASNG